MTEAEIELLMWCFVLAIFIMFSAVIDGLENRIKKLEERNH